MDHTTIADCYKDHTGDYFYRMGGPVRYLGYEDWHPAVTRLRISLKVSHIYEPITDHERL